jgi:predicted transcriptional regulator
MFDDLETRIVLLLHMQTAPVLYEQIVTRLQPDADELEKALASLLSDALLSETQTPDGKRQYTVNMNDEDYRMFFIQELIDKMFDGSSAALIYYMASRGMVKLEGGSYRTI